MPEGRYSEDLWSRWDDRHTRHSRFRWMTFPSFRQVDAFLLATFAPILYYTRCYRAKLRQRVFDVEHPNSCWSKVENAINDANLGLSLPFIIGILPIHLHVNRFFLFFIFVFVYTLYRYAYIFIYTNTCTIIIMYHFVPEWSSIELLTIQLIPTFNDISRNTHWTLADRRVILLGITSDSWPSCLSFHSEIERVHAHNKEG